MGRAGYGIFDSDSVWDNLSDSGLSELAGVDLISMDCSKADWEEDYPPIVSSKDAKAHLDNGNFDRVFNHLKAERDYWHLCLVVGICMRIGVNTSKKQLGYVKRVYQKVEPYLMYHGYKQIELALKEYKSGEPYRLRDFDEDGNLEPDLHAKKDVAPVETEATEKVEVKGKRKHASEEAQDLEEPATKHAKA